MWQAQEQKHTCTDLSEGLDDCQDFLCWRFLWNSLTQVAGLFYEINTQKSIHNIIFGFKLLFQKFLIKISKPKNKLIKSESQSYENILYPYYSHYHLPVLAAGLASRLELTLHSISFKNQSVHTLNQALQLILYFYISLQYQNKNLHFKPWPKFRRTVLGESMIDIIQIQILFFS